MLRHVIKLVLALVTFSAAAIDVDASKPLQEKPRLVAQLGHPYLPFAAVVSPDRRYLISAARSEVIVWERETGREIRRITGHKGNVKGIAVSPSGKQVAIVSDFDRVTRLWNLDDGQLVREFKGHSDNVTSLAFHPDEFKVGVDLFGVANWIRTLRSIPPYWEANRKALYEELGDPNSADSVRLKNISPLFNYQKITKPLIVFQGANDVRVLQAESDEIVEGVKKNGVPVEYVLYPDEGHGFVKKENQITTSKRTLEFLDKYLKPKVLN